MDALAVVVRNDFLNLWNRRKPYRECLVERETTGKPLSYNLSGFFFSSVRRESAERKAKLLASRNQRREACGTKSGQQHHAAQRAACPAMGASEPLPDSTRAMFKSSHLPPCPLGEWFHPMEVHPHDRASRVAALWVSRKRVLRKPHRIP